jgi:hypothetical protein
LSRRNQAKEARRKKRRVIQDARWLPESVLDGLSEDIELAAVLEHLDQRITERGWVFEEEASDDESALWSFPPSEATIGDDDVVPVTSIVMTVDDGGDIAHVVFVGTEDDHQFDIDELFEHLDVIEGYRLGQPLPQFD